MKAYFDSFKDDKQMRHAALLGFLRGTLRWFVEYSIDMNEVHKRSKEAIEAIDYVLELDKR